MRRLGPTLLTLLAVACLMAPPVAVVHAHDDGHDAHGHGVERAGAIHVPLTGHTPPGSTHGTHHAHPHTHPHEAHPTERMPEDVPPEPHVHVEDGLDAVSRARTNASPGPHAVLASLRTQVAGWTDASAVTPAGGRASRPLRARPPDPGRALDVLIALGRLQL